MRSEESSRGRLVADFLNGSWRLHPAPLNFTVSDLELAGQLLYDAGGVGLAWWRIHESDLKTTPAGELLHQAYRLQALQAPIHEERIETAFRLLRGAAIEPMLIKGWSVARLYPHHTLRAYGDVDLFVNPSDYGHARLLLKEANAWWADLHSKLSELPERSFDELYQRSTMQELHGASVRVLSSEDLLALMAVHLFKHGAWRPSWLCDIALMVESRSEDFDWKICFGRSKRQADWIATAISLAQRLLGADIKEAPLPAKVRATPEWLIDATLRSWGSLLTRDRLPIQPRPLLSRSLASPKDFMKEILARWPDPIVATFNLGAKINDSPRFPYQLAAFGEGAGRYLIENAGRIFRLKPNQAAWL